jgi:hypothetical protein
MKTLWMVLVVVLAATVAWAAPSLPIHKLGAAPPVGPNPSWTGPLNDPHAVQGQWFLDPASGAQEVRPYEFHDNVIGQGGGYAGFGAIDGRVVNVLTNPTNGNILSFDIAATITNDTPAMSPWQDGTNSHGEIANPRQQYEGTLYDTKLTIEFALADLQLMPVGFSSPYRQGFLPYIIAANEDQLAWYCYTPGSPPQDQSTAIGNYYVPTWDFGNIPVGQSATRTLSFIVDGAGLDPADPRAEVLVDLQNPDLLANRTSSLKISTWIDNLTADTGLAYPTDPLRGSDASVFHNIPEPIMMTLLGVGGVLLARRKRR